LRADRPEKLKNQPKNSSSTASTFWNQPEINRFGSSAEGQEFVKVCIGMPRAFNF
jgi:hypothetical protein